MTEDARLCSEIQSRLNLLTAPDTAAVRALRREFSRRIAHEAPQTVVQLALRLLDRGSLVLRFIAYEIVSHHKQAFDELSTGDLLKLGKGIDSWGSVDCFAMRSE